MNVHEEDDDEDESIRKIIELRQQGITNIIKENNQTN